MGGQGVALGQQSKEWTGLYQGFNPIVANETSPDGVGFCCYEVRVNGKITADPVNSHAFEVDLSAMGLTLGKGVTVRLMHRPGCAPRMLNPDVLLPSPGFELTSFEAKENGEVLWTTSMEKGRMPFILQQFKWGKWVDVLRVDGQGGPEEKTYSVRVDPVAGINQLRLSHVGADGQRITKGEVSFHSDSPALEWNHDRDGQKIQFSKKTQFEIVDTFGNVVMRGHGDEAILRYLARGEYFVNFGARSETLKKR